MTYICRVSRSGGPAGLVASIDQLIRMGHNPADIANKVKAVIPVSSTVDNHVLLIALYLLR